MTALKQFQRIEASALWRPAAGAQRRDVILSLGKSSLLISDKNEHPLAHWSIAAIERANPGATPAIYHAAGDPSETLELAADETVMVEALETLQKVVEKRRPKPGRLRLGVLTGSLAAVIAIAALWMPTGLRDRVAALTPAVKRAEIGQEILDALSPITGAPCANPVAFPSLFTLVKKLQTADSPAPWRVFVLRSGMDKTAHLPGRIILLGKDMIELSDEPNLVAGHLLREALIMDQTDPLKEYLEVSGFFETMRLLTTGAPSKAKLQAYARHILSAPPSSAPSEALFTRFDLAGLSYDAFLAAVTNAYDDTTIHDKTAVLSDADWLRLQNICTR